MSSPTDVRRSNPSHPVQPMRPFRLSEAKERLTEILGRINSPKNDVVNADPSHPANGPVADAMKLGAKEAKALVAELKLQPPGLANLILDKALPERLKPARHGGVFLDAAAAKALNAAAKAHGLAVRYEAHEPVLPLASPRPVVVPPQISPIEGIVALQQIGNAPVDAKLVARINEIGAQAIAKEAGKGKNVLASVANILDMIAPVAVSLLPTRDDGAAEKASKAKTLASMKKDLGGAHLGDQAFIHQLQTIHAQLIQFKGMITMGNQIVVNEGEALRPAVKDAVSKGFDVDVQSLPLQRDPEGAARTMSANIEKLTTVYQTPAGGGEPKKVQDGLKDVVKANFVSQLDAASVGTLTALLDWKFVFDKALTKNGDVQNADGSVTKKNLMELLTGGRVNPKSRERETVPKMQVAETDGMLFVKIPYDDKKEGSTRIFRIIGAPLVDRANRQATLAKMIGRLSQNEPTELDYHAKSGKIVMPRIKSEGEADPFDLLAHAGVDAKSWSFPLLEGAPVKFSKGIHKGAIEDTEVGTIAKFVAVGGMTRGAMPVQEPPFELRADAPHYNAIVVELDGPNGARVPLKIAEWTIEDFKAAKEPTANRG